jgi:hypothetical protein
LKFGNLVIVFFPGKKELYLLPIARMPHRFEVGYLSTVGQFFASSLKIIVTIFKFLLPMCSLGRCAYWQSSHVSNENLDKFFETSQCVVEKGKFISGNINGYINGYISVYVSKLFVVFHK